jgi:hypothetical protein
MAIRRPSGLLVSIVVSYLDRASALPESISVGKNKILVNWLAILQSRWIFYCILIDFVCQQFVNERVGPAQSSRRWMKKICFIYAFAGEQIQNLRMVRIDSRTGSIMNQSNLLGGRFWQTLLMRWK